MNCEQELKVFANPSVVAHGWYWALPSAALKPNKMCELVLFGKSILLFRNSLGSVHALSAYCPHMGAQLVLGKIEGNQIRCPFHGRKFNSDGFLTEIPCQKNPGFLPRKSLDTFLVAEKFGMIWIHTDLESTQPLPGFSELKNEPVTVRVDKIEKRGCHPTLILGGGVDEEHFLFVHSKTTSSSGPLHFLHERITDSVIRFWNCAEICPKNFKGQILTALYGKVLRYQVTYFSGSTALAELGPLWFRLYAIFAYRPSSDGKTEGLNIYVTPKRKGLAKIFSWISLAVTRSILRAGGREDAAIQNGIRFAVGSETLANSAFSSFVSYIEEQPVLELN